MIFQYSQLKDSINIINRKLTEKNQVQKIFETPCFICFQIRSFQKTQFLYLGKGATIEGVWISDIAPKSILRVKTRFLEYLRAWLKNGFDITLKIDDIDRVLSIKFIKKSEVNNFSYFWNGRKAYFAHFINKNEKTVSWRKAQGAQLDNQFEVFEEVGRKAIEKESEYKESMDINLFLEKQIKKLSTNKKKTKFEHKKLLNMRKDFKKIEDISPLKEKLIKDEISLDGDSVDILGKKIKFGAEEEHFSRRDKAFTRLKKLERSKSILERRLKEQESKISNTSSETFVVNNLRVLKPIWGIETDIKKPKKLTTGIIEETHFGVRFIYGKTARANDLIRNQFAHKNDWWFHLDDSTSSHLIIKTEEQPSEEILVKVAQLLTKTESTEVDLIYTQIKNLKSVKGKPGSVIVKKEKRRRVYINE
jgi:predicted ribosome quality control (RQC) complex YloA/Tae2 family protein